MNSFFLVLVLPIRTFAFLPSFDAPAFSAVGSDVNAMPPFQGGTETHLQQSQQVAQVNNRV